MKINFNTAKITILFLWCFAALSGCREQGFGGEASAELCLVPSFAQSTTGKATDTGFQTGDQVGLYAGFENRQLDPDGNLINNALMEATDQSGVIALSGNPAIYYPSAKEAVRLYAYYPYQANITSARALAATVQSDQGNYVDYTASDWCWGSLATTPMVVATPIVFHHRTAQVNLNATLPASGKIGTKTIAKVTTSTLHGVYGGGAFDLSSGTWSNLDNQGDLSPLRPDAAANRFLTVLPPQTVQAGKVFASIAIEYSDATTETFDFTPENPITLTAGVSTTVAIALDEKGAVSLTTVQIEDWVETSANGAIIDPVNNPFTLHWRLPHHYFARVSRVELVLDLPDGKKLTVEAKNVKVEAGGTKMASSHTFEVAMEPSTGIAYPYQIGAVRFYDGQDLLQECASVLGATVYRSGKYTIGVEQDRLLAVRSGVISDWNELLYGDRLKGVDNDFAIQMIEYPSYESIKGVKLVIDGQPYTFHSVSAIEGSHAMLSQTSVFRFPDASGKAPYKYPFVVEEVTLLDAVGSALGDGRYGCAIRVSRAGAITMQLYRGVLSELATTVVGYNSSAAVGRPEYGGAVTSNPVRVIYCDGRQQAACDQLARVDLTIGGREVALTGYSLDGTRFAAQSRAPHIDIVSGGVDRPTTYPYEITAVKFRKADGTLLAAASLATPLVVDWWGEISFEVLEQMADMPHVAHRPSPADYVEIGGLRWAVGNLVAVDNRNCKVGAPTDGGVYFQFGSLIGWKGGNLASRGTGLGIPDGAMQTDGQLWNGAATWSWANDVMVSPAEFTPTNTWPQNLTTNGAYFGLGTTGTWNLMGKKLSDLPGFTDGALVSATVAVGDPCRYYLGDPWRQPTDQDYAALFRWKNHTYAQGTYNLGSWGSPAANDQGVGVIRSANYTAQLNSPDLGRGLYLNTNATTASAASTESSALFLPAAGYRSNTNGAFYLVGRNGYFWAGSIYSDANGLRLTFDVQTMYPQHGNTRSFSYPARCVSEAPRQVNTPTANDYVEVDMGSGKKLKWAKGNLIATSGRGCKVGAPSDGGVYFQFGSLIGWKGGSLANKGNGKGMPDASWHLKYWNGAAAWSWNNDVMVAPTELTTKPAVWQVKDEPNTETHSNYYFNYSKQPYATPFQSIRDYPGLTTGALADKGIGDACSYYLGGSWRLPTAEEYKILCNNTTTDKWADCKASWSVYDGVLGGYFSSNKLFFSSSGYRDTTNGAFLLGDHGHGWSSSVFNAIIGLNLGLDAEVVYPQSTNERSNGAPARCVSE